MLGHLVSSCTFVLASKTLVEALVLPPKRLSRGAGETLPRPAPGRVPGVAALLWCCALVGSRPCTHRPRFDRLVGLRCPFVAPVPCCTLDHAVLSRSGKLQQNGVNSSLFRAVHLLIIANGRPWCIEKPRGAQQERRKCRGSW